MNAPDRVLAAAVRLLPPGRREWGTAMRAELASLRGDRWRFTLGCVRAVATLPAVWRRAAGPTLLLGVVAATVWFTADVGYEPLRWGLVGLVCTLVVIACLGRLRPLGPVGDHAAARAVRAGGLLLIGALAAETVVSLAHKDSRDVTGVPVLTVMFAGYLLGFLALTARRSTASSRTLVAGALAGVGAAAAWTAMVFAFPPIPPGPALAVLTIALGAGVAATIAGHRAALLAASCAGTVGALLTLHAVLALSTWGPAGLIPDLAPAALTPADNLANSRIELQDPYLWLLLLGWLIALTQAAPLVKNAASQARHRL
ncbi:hypothetical protein [Asanoa iriomotensis]|uniref:hypothetical protein n=1 Tax=Asanoa iriomotensis TaxID=234613 RepID=UPI001945A187|nr:hypothetical protein [Asanoa iriomotensis]